ncbi:hypothetical protein DY000_02033693 [Brassica cretica]|uniref:RNase H type-1 domain-containing protein n=1 Tax=Brassica cretica TaxID=69181 RepID=A0ABQ7DSM1_BRACR|nr:hypothetical protein DY000_02033693 [Brassica cretica]
MGSVTIKSLSTTVLRRKERERERREEKRREEKTHPFFSSFTLSGFSPHRLGLKAPPFVSGGRRLALSGFRSSDHGGSFRLGFSVVVLLEDGVGSALCSTSVSAGVFGRIRFSLSTGVFFKCVLRFRGSRVLCSLSAGGLWRRLVGSIAGEASALSRWGLWQHAKEVARVEAAETSRLRRSEPLLGLGPRSAFSLAGALPEGSGLETAIFRPAVRTTASSRGGSLSCRRRLYPNGYLVGLCFDSSGLFVSGWWLEAAGAVASRFEGAYLSVARGNRLFSSAYPARLVSARLVA